MNWNAQGQFLAWAKQWASDTVKQSADHAYSMVSITEALGDDPEADTTNVSQVPPKCHPMAPPWFSRPVLMPYRIGVFGSKGVTQRMARKRPLRQWFAWFVFSLVAIGSAPSAEASSAAVVISQIYGGGGNSGATLRNDFVDLFNRSDAAVSVDGWTVQYASSTGSTWERIPLTGSIAPGGYYLVAAATGTGGTIDLPPAQASGGVNLSATSGKVALVASGTLMTGTCP